MSKLDSSENNTHCNTEKISMDKIIRDIEKEVDYFCSNTGEAYLSITNENGISSVIPIDSDGFGQWFRFVCYDRYQIILPAGGANQAQEHIKMQALRKGEKREIHRRIAKVGKAIYYDLLREDGKVLKITGEGIKNVKTKRVMFIHDEITAPQKEPIKVSPEKIRYYMKKYFNLQTEKDEILLMAFLISCFWAKEIFHPILQVYGEKGSAKSTCLKKIQDLIDPHTTELYALQPKVNEVAICLASNFMVCFDNVSRIPMDISDLFCRACTGGIQSSRKLYTNNTQSLLELKSIICFNGTSQNIVRSDLADRTLFLQLERIDPEKMKSEHVMKAEWEKDLPQFFGALCTVVSGVLEDKEPIQIPSPIRLCDFYEIAVKAGRQFGFSEEEVYKAFEANKKAVNDAILSENTILTIIYELMYSKGFRDVTYKDTMTNFYRDLKEFALEEYWIDRRNFPGSASHLSRKLNENKSNLEEMGIYFNIKPGKNAKIIEMWREK